MDQVKRINNLFKFAFRVISIIFCASLIYANFFNCHKLVFAETVDTKIDLNNDGKAEIVKFNQGVISISLDNGKVIFTKDEDKNVYRHIAFIKDKKIGDTKILIQSKTKDTSGTLSYSIYKMDGSQLKEIVHKEDIYKGVIKVQNSTDIVEDVPVYSNGNSNAVPTFTVKNYFTLQDNKLVLIKTEKLSYASSNSNINSSVYYKNPTHAEIEKILEDVAYEKGIPAEIFKAIAWQETKGADKDNNYITNWRQFSNGQPLIGYDHIGIGIMQVSDYDPNDTAYINRLKYDIEFNIRQGAEILLVKWALQNSSPTWKTPKVGDASPVYLEHWYYAIWAYNGYASINNPATNHAKAYQTIVIGHVNNVFNTPMLDLYVYKPSLFVAGVYPRTDIEEISGKHAGDFRIKDKSYKYITTTNLTIRDINNNTTGSFNKNDVVTIKAYPVTKASYVRYYVEGYGKSGYVVGNWIRPIGDANKDRVVDIYDFVKQSKNINSQGTVVNDANRISTESSDVNMDGVVDIRDIALAAVNYNFSMYRNNITN
ncbi:hypothetical protein LGK95_08650 [Clostridium algoriphilum]|uniref:hypothetical protein n=1 Tax=Clostridium algoriphilum TaxID=198347 RepID=UPI001CF14DBC|nr:hypothetical protein [Clostridium algoriphilum]MCB2293590.1 hypothetical protein [Clostridium algoriphilum]